MSAVFLKVLEKQELNDTAVLAGVWILGIFLLVAYSLIGYYRRNRHTKASTPVSDDTAKEEAPKEPAEINVLPKDTIRKCDGINTPFVLGVAPDCIGEIPEKDIYVYGYSDDDATWRGVAIAIGADVNYFDWEYASPRMILPDLYWDESRRQLQISFHTEVETGIEAEELYVLQYYDSGTLIPAHFTMGHYTANLKASISYSFDEKSKKLTLFSQKTKAELANVEIPEGKVTGMEYGNLSWFQLGETITFSTTPGYYLDGSVTPQYEKMPTLEYEVTLNARKGMPGFFGLKEKEPF